MLNVKNFYTRTEIRSLLHQPVALIGCTYTKINPSTKSISLIIKVLAENLGCVGALFIRPTPTVLRELGIKTYTVKRGRLSYKIIPLIQYVLDNSNFIYLAGEMELTDWLRNNNFYHTTQLKNLFNQINRDTYDQSTIDTESVVIERKVWTKQQRLLA